MIRPFYESILRQDGDFGGAAPGSSGGGSVDPEIYTRYVNGTATEEDLIALVQAGEITVNQAQEYKASALGPLLDDLGRLGLYPYDPSTGLVSAYPSESPIGSRAVEENLGRPTTYADPRMGLLYDREGNRLPQYLQPGEGRGGSGDPYAGAKFAEQVRQNRIAEAMDAISLQQARQKAMLEGAQFAVNPSQGPYFPGFSPTSPAVSAGLTDPFQYVPTAYNANFDQGQLERDLAMIRGGAGVG